MQVIYWCSLVVGILGFVVIFASVTLTGFVGGVVLFVILIICIAGMGLLELIGLNEQVLQSLAPTISMISGLTIVVIDSLLFVRKIYITSDNKSKKVNNERWNTAVKASVVLFLRDPISISKFSWACIMVLFCLVVLFSGFTSLAAASYFSAAGYPRYFARTASFSLVSWPIIIAFIHVYLFMNKGDDDERDK
jgi:hypothetical protein